MLHGYAITHTLMQMQLYDLQDPCQLQLQLKTMHYPRFILHPQYDLTNNNCLFNEIVYFILEDTAFYLRLFIACCRPNAMISKIIVLLIYRCCYIQS